MPLTGVLALAAALAAGPALAHVSAEPPTPETVWHHWSVDPLTAALLIASATLYGVGLARLWGRAGRGRGVMRTQAALFALGMGALVVALVSPLDALGGALLSAHMVQHAILVAVAPPLLVAGVPFAAVAWALPSTLRRTLSRGTPRRAIAAALGWTVRPLPAAALHGVALWLWHAPALYEAALKNPWLHWLEHASFLVTAMLFWQAVARAGRGAASVPAGMAACFLTMLHGGFLSALITFAPAVIYQHYLGRTDPFGLDALADQQLAGILMGAPMGAVYLGAGLMLMARLLGPEENHRYPEAWSSKSSA